MDIQLDANVENQDRAKCGKKLGRRALFNDVSLQVNSGDRIKS